VRGLIGAAALRGISPAEILRNANLRPEQLACADARISHAEVSRLCELVLDLTGDPALGLHFGERPAGPAYNPITDLIAHAGTLRAGLEALRRFHPLLSDHASFELSEEDHLVTLRYRPLSGVSERVQRFASEAFVLGLYQMLRAFRRKARLERASFAYPAPDYRAEYTRVFHGRERFEQPFTGLVFDRALLDSVSPLRDEAVHDALRAVAERHMARTQGAPTTLRVRELLVRERGSRTDMSTVARALGLSVRSLRRRLSAEGTSYAAVVNDALAAVAKHHLVDRGRSIQETAYEMGFSDSSAFHRAFKTWTGTTPRAFRDSQG
jgi:AraC-like DNA-binding protein